MPQSDRVQQLKESRQRAFVEAFLTTANVSHACRAADIDRSTHYHWLKTDAEYAEVFQHAEEEATDALEAEARRRAVEGVSEPVGWFQGNPGGYVQRYSDTLLIFLLKGARPEKYKERHEHSGDSAQPLTFRIVRE